MFSGFCAAIVGLVISSELMAAHPATGEVRAQRHRRRGPRRHVHVGGRDDWWHDRRRLRHRHPVGRPGDDGRTRFIGKRSSAARLSFWLSSLTTLQEERLQNPCRAHAANVIVSRKEVVRSLPCSTFPNVFTRLPDWGIDR